MSRDPALQKNVCDSEYSRRYNRFFLTHLLPLLPLLIFAGAISLELSYVPWRAIGLAGAACALVFVFLHGVARRSILAAMRREGLIGDGYEPPAF
jgi:hypothetical protein